MSDESSRDERLRTAYQDLNATAGRGGEASPRRAAYVFSSFDLVNSTSYKTRASEEWPNVTQGFYYSVERAVEGATKDDDNLRPEVWKYIGDEVVMFTRVYSAAEVEAVVAVTATVCLALQGQFSTRDDGVRRSARLGVKACCWVALVGDRATEETRNIQLQTRAIPLPDFLGPDIDAGFRIGKRAMRGAVTLTALLAHVIVTANKSQSRRMRLAGYDQLKGVWDGRPYPCLLYRSDWQDVADEFDYDELMGKQLSELDAANLETVLAQTGNLQNTSQLLEYFEEATRPSPVARASTTESEVHIAAACFDPLKRRVLMRRRRSGKDVEKPGLWDFGCAVLTGQRRAPETLTDEYKTKYDVDISVGEHPPLSYFSFERRGRFVSGFVFAAQVTNPEAEPVAYNDYQLEWFDVENGPPTDSVSDAKGVFDELTRLHPRQPNT